MAEDAPGTELDVASEETRVALGAYLTGEAGADSADVRGARRLTGGAIHEHWLLDAVFAGGPHEGARQLVLRVPGAAELGASHAAGDEFRIVRAAFEAGVTVPEPLWFCDDRSVIGRPFAVSRFVEGEAAGHILVRDETIGGPRPALLEQIGVELARIQTVRPPREDLPFLEIPELSVALARVAEYRANLDEHVAAGGRPRPGLEWVMRWLELEAPPAGDLVLTHNDYRVGNFIVGDDGVRAVLDWEFARWGDPMEDVGWFVARCWRFNRYDRPAGGLGDAEDFYRGYVTSGRELDPAVIHYWQVMAHARWAVVAIQQGERHTSGRQPSLELALTGRLADELELEGLTLIEEAERGEYDP